MNDNSAYREGWREEMIGGEIVVMYPATTTHAYVVDGIFCAFKNYLKGKRWVPFRSGVTVHLTEDDWFVPDVVVVCDRGKIKPDGVYGAPDLVVEVLSPSTAKNDRTRKMEVYERCGVREYWLVGPSDKIIEVYWLDNGKFTLHDIYTLHPDWMLAQMSDVEKTPS